MMMTAVHCYPSLDWWVQIVSQSKCAGEHFQEGAVEESVRREAFPGGGSIEESFLKGAFPGGGGSDSA